MKTVPILLFALTALLSVTAFPHDTPSHTRPALTWLDRPWEIRYILFVNSANEMNTAIALAKQKNNVRPGPKDKEMLYFFADEMFEMTATFKTPDADTLSTVLVSFDAEGHVTGPNQRLRRFSAKRSLIDALVLVDDGYPKRKPYFLARWDQGIPGDVSFSPAVCTAWDAHLYSDGWNRDSYIAAFGCREWTAQLYRHDRPYIDVTSYTSHGNYIGEFVGWSRLTDQPKPVIGLQGKAWLCLHECPAGEQAGVIPDIKAWIRKHSYPMPERPPEMPIYPNRNYQDDLHELDK